MSAAGRADHRSVAYDVSRAPGTWAVAQARRRRRRVWLCAGAFFVAAGLMLVLALGHRVTTGAAALFLGVVLAAKPYADRFTDEALRWLGGARAEQAVGETLNALRHEGWVLLHDVEQRGEGNIDHIASGPNGVFLIETKQRRYQDVHLVKAKRQAAKLHDELGVWVTPVICLHERDAEPFRARGVWIVPRLRLLDWLCVQQNKRVEFERLARFADSVGAEPRRQPPRRARGRR